MTEHQRTVLIALEECARHEGTAVTAGEVAEWLRNRGAGVWFQSHVYNALWRLALKQKVRRVGVAGQSTTWMPM